MLCISTVHTSYTNVNYEYARAIIVGENVADRHPLCQYKMEKPRLQEDFAKDLHEQTDALLETDCEDKVVLFLNHLKTYQIVSAKSTPGNIFDYLLIRKTKENIDC